MQNETPSPAASPDAGLLNIQVHIDLAHGLDIEAFKTACGRVVESGHAIRLSFVRSDDDGAHIDACFEAFDTAGLWSQVSGFILDDPHLGAPLRDTCVVVRTGSQGWDDYQLLSSYREEPSPS